MINAIATKLPTIIKHYLDFQCESIFSYRIVAKKITMFEIKFFNTQVLFQSSCSNTHVTKAQTF